MKLTRKEMDNVQAIADEFVNKLSEAGCDAVVLGVTYDATHTGTGWSFRTTGNTFAARDLARLYVEDTTRIFVENAKKNEGDTP